MDTLEQQNTEVLARYLYEVDGRPCGREGDYWSRAERQLSENIFCDNFGIQPQAEALCTYLAEKPMPRAGRYHLIEVFC